MDLKVKIILIVCEPVRRTISQFAMQVSHGRFSNTSFEDFLSRREKKCKVNFNESGTNLVEVSYNSLNFPKWLQLNSFEQIHIVDGEKLRTEPYLEVAKTERFLGLQKRIKESGFVFDKIINSSALTRTTDKIYHV